MVAKGKVSVTAWITPEAKEVLRLWAFQKRRTLSGLLAEKIERAVRRANRSAVVAELSGCVGACPSITVNRGPDAGEQVAVMNADQTTVIIQQGIRAPGSLASGSVVMAAFAAELFTLSGSRPDFPRDRRRTTRRWREIAPLSFVPACSAIP